MRIENELSYKIIGSAIEVHKELGGPGMLESIYESALIQELHLNGLPIQNQVPVQIAYKGIKLRDPLYLDIIVDQKIIVEVKATEKHNVIYETQLLTYLRLTGIKLGLLINFGADQIKNGIHRIVNNF